MMKKLILLFGLLLPLFSAAQVHVYLNSGDYIHITGAFSETQNYIFHNTIPVYTPELLTKGLHFENGQNNSVSNDFLFADANSSQVVGVHGSSTKLTHQGLFRADDGNTKPSIVLTNGGHYVVGENCHVDLINSAYFTRQFWIYGDGSGKFEFAPGFVADRTNLGYSPDGLGSIRLSNTILISNHTQNLPLGYRPNWIEGNGINSHLVFENEPGSVWRVLTNDQNYQGGLWCYVDMTVETVQNLTISGTRCLWGDYTNYGGVMFRNENLTLTKTGMNKLILTGDHGYNPGSKFVIQQGTIEFYTDPYNPAADLPSNISNGQHLSIEAQPYTKLSAYGESFRIDTLDLQENATLETDLNTSAQANYASIAGKLHVVNTQSTPLYVNDAFQVFVAAHTEGEFSELILPSLAGDKKWDTTQLYTTGVIRVVQRSQKNVQFAESNQSIAEGNEAEQSLNVEVIVSPPPEEPITVQISADGQNTTASGADYAITSSTLNFAQGDSTETLEIVVYGDTDTEEDETLVLEISDLSGDNAVIGSPASFTLTIENDDGNSAIENANQGFEIFPNPAKETLHLRLPPQTENFTIQLFDRTGKSVFQKHATTPRQSINISAFAKGIYILQVEANGKTSRKKIVLE